MCSPPPLVGVLFKPAFSEDSSACTLTPSYAPAGYLSLRTFLNAFGYSLFFRVGRRSTLFSPSKLLSFSLIREALLFFDAVSLLVVEGDLALTITFSGLCMILAGTIRFLPSPSFPLPLPGKDVLQGDFVPPRIALR